jgi:hypothetical protein
MLATMAGLAPLEIEPWRILVSTIVGVRAVVDAGRLTIRIPARDLRAARRYLRLIA